MAYIDVSGDDDGRYRLLIDSIVDYAIYMLDASGRVSSWNPGAQRFKGYLASEIIGQHFSRFYTDEDRASGVPSSALQKARDTGRFEAEGWRVRKDGTRFWAHVVIDPIRTPGGEIGGFAKITRDLTERMEAQKSLAKTREALLQAQKLEAIGQLTGGVAHDFNNLLMAVMGSLHLLRKHLPQDNPKALMLLENALQGAERGAALTKRMLAFARKQELKLETVDVGLLIEGMAGLLDRSVGPSVGLSLRLDPDLPQVLTDPHQLETALLNLVVNARDAMPDGGPVIIGAEMRSAHPAQDWGLPAGDYVLLSVTDEGQGMEPEVLTRASEPFFTTKDVGRGTGLGLSMVHGLVQQSGGLMHLESRPGQGTRVELWIPAHSGPKLGDLAESAVEAPAAKRGLTILAVDDDNLVLMNTVAMLEDMGHHPLAASSADEAMRVLEHQAVDMILTDYAMPRMSGLDLAREIKALRPLTPVLLASGYAELPAEVAEALPRLHKPYTQAELAHAIHRLSAQIL